MAVGLPAFRKGRSVRIFAVVNKVPAEHRLLSIAGAGAKIEAWRWDYNESRPYTSLGWMTPVEYAAAAAAKVAE